MNDYKDYEVFTEPAVEYYEDFSHLACTVTAQDLYARQRDRLYQERYLRPESARGTRRTQPPTPKPEPAPSVQEPDRSEPVEPLELDDHELTLFDLFGETI